MSYDIVISYTAPTSRDWSPTYNLRDIFSRALFDGGDESLHSIFVDTPAAEAIPRLEKAVQYIQDHREELYPFQPENGWGTFDGALQVLTEMLETCREHPDAKVTWL